MCGLTRQFLLWSLFNVQFGGGQLVAPQSDCEMVQKAYQNFVHSSDRCLFVSMDQIDCPLSAAVTNITIFAFSLDQLFTGMILNHQKLVHCDKVLLFIPDLLTFRYHIQNENLEGAFSPFTSILIYTTANEKFKGIVEKKRYIKSVISNGLFMSFARILNDTHYEMEDVLTNEAISYSHSTELDDYVKARQSYHLHPLFHLKDKEFNVSLFHCPPHVIKLGDNMTLDSYDGAEFRFLREITQGWKVNIFDRTFLFDIGDTWEQVILDVESRRSSMGMCSMWLTDANYHRVDLSQYFSHLCGMFLVPDPKPVSPAKYLYLPMSTHLWWCIIGALLITALLYFCMFQSSFGHDKKETTTESLGRAFLDVLAIATSHGIPVVVRRIPIRLLIIAWILLSFFLGTAFNTKYTSLLTQPLFTKTVDTLQDFLDEGLVWGEVGDKPTWNEHYLTSGNPLYIQLASQMIVEKSVKDRLELIPKGGYARYVKILNRNYVTDTETFAAVAHYLRPMKSCVDNYFTVFPFSRNSPYKPFVDRKLDQYTDSGIINHWFALMTIKHGRSYIAEIIDKNRVREKTEKTPLELEHVIGAFYVLGIGQILALVSFIAEQIVHKRQPNLVRKGRAICAPLDI